jgi:hypothetical protein
MPSTRRLDEGAIFVVSIDPTADWDHSTFPEPLITVDYDRDGKVIKIVAVGKAARELAQATSDRLSSLIDDRAVAREVASAVVA